MTLIVTLFIFILILFFIYRSMGLHLSTSLIAFLIILFAAVDILAGAILVIFMLIFLLIAIPLNIKPIRKALISRKIFTIYKKKLPKVSETEEIALNAGDTWFEQDLFRGAPDWNKLHNIGRFSLSNEERDFINNETSQLCQMIDDWKVMRTGDLPIEVWKFMRDKGFFGLVIDKKFGGKGFSGSAHSQVVMKVASRSTVGSVTVMVPNSLGPGELLQHYGTKEQKEKYLPRLASGIDIPCFALTEPNAGSDATSIQSTGIICKKQIDGQEVIGINLKFNKRYITLAPVATLIGLAFNLKDPNKLLKSKKGKEGITCALIERDIIGPGIGNRHFPSGVPFMNGTIKGEDIFIPIDCIIGGESMAGQGWRMLVECLSIGRSISLPALSTAAVSVSFLSTGAYSVLRKQFGVTIGNFEGVEEKLAKIAGYSYMLNACRELTVLAVDNKLRPSVASAIAKYHMTEKTREALNCAYDVHAGKAVVIGPKNYLFSSYMSVPVAITVEGANIMTRNLLVFGQGSMACHPYLKKEILAVSNNSFNEFDRVLWGHCGYLFKNLVHTIVSGLTFGLFIRSPKSPLSKYYKRVTMLSYSFSFLSDLSVLYLGASLKRKERLSARLGDILSNLYIASSILKYFKDNGESKEEMIFAKWALEYTIHAAQEAMGDFLREFPSKSVGRTMSIISFPFGKRYHKPSDKLDRLCAKVSMESSGYRSRIMDQVFISQESEDGLALIEKAFQLNIETRSIYEKILISLKNKDLKRGDFTQVCQEAMNKNIVTEEEYLLLIRGEKYREKSLQVDEFPFKSMQSDKMDPV